MSGMKNWRISRRGFLCQAGLATGAGLMGTARGIRAESLPELSPAAAGVDAAGILGFLDEVEAAGIELHSFLLARRGSVVASGWWAPYAPDLPHTLYSLSKSFTSTGVGLLVDEGKLSPDDPVAGFFPEELPGPVSGHPAALRVRHLLTMTTGHAADPTRAMVESRDWLREFFAHPLEHEPGARFVYNSGATYVLSAIVQKVTGRTLVDYLQDRLFDPLGIARPEWEVCPRGICTGGWGLSLPTEAVARFGMMLLQGGAWNGQRILSPEWVADATSRQFPPDPPAESDSDWAQGYGYQFWRCRHNAFRGDGAFGQFAVVIPERQAVVVMTAETGNMQAQLNLLWKYVLPALSDAPLPEDRELTDRLRVRLASLALPLPKGEPEPAAGARVSGRRFRLDPAAGKGGAVTLTFEQGRTRIELEQDGRRHLVVCGSGRWIRGFAGLPGTPPRLLGGGPPPGTPHPVAAAGAWTDENTFAATLRFHTTPHHDVWSFRFEGDSLTISFRSSIVAMNPSASDPRPALTGRLETA